MVPFSALAHGTSYLEFNPDQASSLKDADVATPSQVFFAQSDFLGGFDLWIANPGSSGTATFSLVNDQDIVLTSKTVTIPNIALTSSGTKFHVDFNSQLPVLADDKYSIRVTSSMPELRLYYANTVQVLSHNAPFTSPYMTGVARLGNEEQSFSFKYSLYETNEGSAPIISNVGWTVVSENQMRVDFNANEAIDYKIEYGPSGQGYGQSTNFLNDYQFCVDGIALCSIIISVSPDTQYDYRLTVKDSWNNQSQINGTFTSGQGQTPLPSASPNDQPAVISNLRVAEITNNSVGIAWTTNEIANSRLLISFSSDLITITNATDPTYELEHFLETDPVLGAGTTYLATVRSTDLGNNETTASLSFTTLSQPTPTPTPPPTSSPTPVPSPTNQPNPSPTISVQTSPEPQPTEQINNSPEGPKVNWPAPSEEPSDGYRVDVFDEEGKLIKTIFVPSGLHEAVISEVPAGDYKVIVYENNEGVFKKVDTPSHIKVGDSFFKRLISFWPYLAVVLVLIGVFAWMQLRKKSSQTVKQVVV